MNSGACAEEIVLRQVSARFERDKRPWARSLNVAKMVKEPASHRVFFSFIRQKSGWWFCRVHEDDLGKTPLSRLITFRDAAKVVEMVRRGRGLAGITSRQDLDEAIAHGRGQTMLILDDTQYEAVSRKS